MPDNIVNKSEIIVFISVSEVMRRLAIRKTKLYELINTDKNFPKPVPGRPVRFVEGEVSSYQRAMMGVR